MPKKHEFGRYAPSRYIVNQILDDVFLTVYPNPVNDILRAYQDTVDKWGARRRAFLSAMERSREGLNHGPQSQRTN